MKKKNIAIKRETLSSCVWRVRHFPGNAFDPKMAFVRMETFLRNVTFLQKSDTALMVPFQTMPYPARLP